MNKVINYISYQSFPAETANSLQTISNLKYLKKNNYDIRLFFPLREKNSSDDLKTIQKYYLLDQEITINGIKHPYPFGKIKYFNKLLFHISHYLWAKSTAKKFNNNKFTNEFFLTRSDWVLFFLAKKNYKIIFECHQYSKLRNYVFNRVASKNNVKIIFLNEFIKKEFSEVNTKNILLSSGVDLEIFNAPKTNVRVSKKITFVGNLLRFGKERSLDTVINAFSTPELKNYQLNLIGGPENEAMKIRKLIEEKNISNIKVAGRLNRIEIVQELLSSTVGLLINAPDKHSKYFTSPLKYFEYLAVGLRVIAIDFPSHRVLPNQENIFYFENNEDSLIKAVKEACNSDFKEIDLQNISLDNRAKKIIELFESF
tara:strand:+ start:6627 stop:7736 length:1110 start_codon:yes stop_codon:yes gene_type:complete